MPNMALSHFEATLLMALLISAVLGITGRKTNRDRLFYGIRCFAYFVATVFGLAWLMHLGHG